MPQVHSGGRLHHKPRLSGKQGSAVFNLRADWSQVSPTVAVWQPDLADGTANSNQGIVHGGYYAVVRAGAPGSRIQQHTPTPPARIGVGYSVRPARRSAPACVPHDSRLLGVGTFCIGSFSDRSRQVGGRVIQPVDRARDLSA
jgi:hypothetical protein